MTSFMRVHMVLGDNQPWSWATVPRATYLATHLHTMVFQDMLTHILGLHWLSQDGEGLSLEEDDFVRGEPGKTVPRGTIPIRLD